MDQNSKGSRGRNRKNRRRRGNQKSGNKQHNHVELKDRDLMAPWKGNPFRWSGKHIEVVKESRPTVHLECKLCGEPIENPAEAFSLEAEKVHFDCLLKTVNFGVELKENQKVCYVGRGEFGLCEFKDSRCKGSFTVLQRFSVESQDDRDSLIIDLEDGGTDWGVNLNDFSYKEDKLS